MHTGVSVVPISRAGGSRPVERAAGNSCWLRPAARSHRTAEAALPNRCEPEDRRVSYRTFEPYTPDPGGADPAHASHSCHPGKSRARPATALGDRKDGTSWESELPSARCP